MHLCINRTIQLVIRCIWQINTFSMSETWQRKKKNGIIILFSLASRWLAHLTALNDYEYVFGLNVVIRHARLFAVCVLSSFPFSQCREYLGRNAAVAVTLVTTAKAEVEAIVADAVAVAPLSIVGGLFGESKIFLYILGYGDDNCCCWSLIFVCLCGLFTHFAHFYVVVTGLSFYCLSYCMFSWRSHHKNASFAATMQPA